MRFNDGLGHLKAKVAMSLAQPSFCILEGCEINQFYRAMNDIDVILI